MKGENIMVAGLSLNIGDKYDEKHAKVKLKNGEEIQVLDRNHDGKIDQIIIENKPQRIDNRNMLVFENLQDNDYNGKIDYLESEARIQKNPHNYRVMYSKRQNLLTGEKRATTDNGRGAFLLGMLDGPILTTLKWLPYPRNSKMYQTSTVFSDNNRQAHLKETGVDITKEMAKVDKLFPLNSQ